MDTPVNPPAIVPQPSIKNQFDSRLRQKLPPRFAKQKENNRLQKVHLQGIYDVGDMNKVNQNAGGYGIKDGLNPASGPIANAWDKPLAAHLRTEQETTVLNVVADGGKCNLETVEGGAGQNNALGMDKGLKSNHLPDKTVLDGTTPPVNTIIFENTNFKSAPGTRPSRSDKKMDENAMDGQVMAGFNKPMRDLLNKTEKPSDGIQMQLAFRYV